MFLRLGLLVEDAELGELVLDVLEAGECGLAVVGDGLDRRLASRLLVARRGVGPGVEGGLGQAVGPSGPDVSWQALSSDCRSRSLAIARWRRGTVDGPG